MRDESEPWRGNRRCGGHLIILEAPVALLLRTESGVGSADDFHADAWFVPQEELLQRLLYKRAGRALAVKRAVPPLVSQPANR